MQQCDDDPDSDEDDDMNVDDDVYGITTVINLTEKRVISNASNAVTFTLGFPFSMFFLVSEYGMCCTTS